MRNKKTIFLFLLVQVLISCNQNNKASDLHSDHHTSVAQHDTLLNIDALNASPANFKLLLENDYVRVLEYTLQPGQKDTPHTHPPKSSYVVQGGKIKVFTDKGEELIFDETAGTAEWSEYVGKHQVENIGSTSVKIILTEVKQNKLNEK